MRWETRIRVAQAAIAGQSDHQNRNLFIPLGVRQVLDGPQAPVFLSHPMAGNERLVSALRHLQLFVGGGH